VAKLKTTGRKLNKLKEVLQKQGKTQSWLSEKLDLDYETVNRYVNNRRQPTLDTLFEIAKLLKVSPTELLNV
jgi:putative transcriptional regulator